MAAERVRQTELGAQLLVRLLVVYIPNATVAWTGLVGLLLVGRVAPEQLLADGVVGLELLVRHLRE